MTSGPKCITCGTPVDAELFKHTGHQWHYGCEPLPVDQAVENENLSKALDHIIRWADQHSTRSLQKMLGPSEIGDPCERRIGYSLAGIPQVNFRSDPWAAIVGTAIHGWLEDAVNKYQAEVENLGWNAEGTLQIDSLVKGHTDLYNGDVIDYKTKEKDDLERIRHQGPKDREKIQAHLYGLGHFRAGRPVRDVVLVFLPRNGRLRDKVIWREPFNPDIALAALERMYSIADKVMIEEVLTKPENWNNIPALPSRTACWYCPFWQERDAEHTADNTGCPGDSAPAAERLQKSQAQHLKKFNVKE